MVNDIKLIKSINCALKANIYVQFFQNIIPIQKHNITIHQPSIF